MADLERTPSSRLSSFFFTAPSKRRTWVSLFLLVYSLFLSSSWNHLLLSICTWYKNTDLSPWPALYASVLYGGVFGLLAMVAALVVTVPATLVTWITALILLAFTGRPRTQLVVEGRRIIADITVFAFRILVREGKLVIVCLTVVSFVAFLVKRRQWTQQQTSTN